MQKYIAVVNHRMDNDEISKLIANDIGGALFCISHQNYPLAAELIHQIKELSRKHHRPISIIQDVSGMTDPLDLEFGLASGVDWVVVADPKHAAAARKIDKSVSVIWKGDNIPKGLNPDAMIMDSKSWNIRHFDFAHPQHKVFSALLKIADHAHVDTVMVSEIKVAKALSAMHPNQRIVYFPKDKNKAGHAGIYPGVHPIFDERHLGKKGERVLDARDGKHATIKTL